MSLGRSGGQSLDPKDGSEPSADYPGVIEEIDVHDLPQARMAGSIRDWIFVGVFAVALLGVIGIAITNVFADGPTEAATVATPTPTGALATATARPSPSPDPTERVLQAGITEPLPVGADGPLERGMHRIDDPFQVPATFTVPAGWRVWAYTEAGSQVNLVDPGVGEVSLEVVDNVSADPCATDVLDPAVGPTVDDLVAALTDLEGFSVSAATDIEVDGFSGKQLTMTAPEDPPCMSLYTWRTSTRHNGVGAGEVNEVRILDVDGIRLVINVAHGPTLTKADRSTLNSVVDSIHLGGG